MTTALQDIDIPAIVDIWRDKPGNLIMILHQIQNTLGYVPREAAQQISRSLEVPLARIYEVITFYTYFKLKPPGRHNIAVCMGTACYLKGGAALLEEIKKILKIQEGETTPDGMFHLETVRCVGCCGLAPTVMIAGKVLEGAKRPELLKRFEELRRSAAAKSGAANDGQEI